jgi:rhodanese-related sulfurtransferase
MRREKFRNIYLLFSIIIFILVFIHPLYASHKGIYPVKRQHEGVDIKPKEAFRLISKNQGNSYIVDVRSRYEYQDVGHPVGSYNIPVFFYTTETGPRGYKMIPNDKFCRDLKARFNPETDYLFMICRSGERSTTAVAEAVKCGFRKNRVYNVMGGFEGDKVHEEESPFSGQRLVGGWRLEGLPWTYKMIQELMYLPDIGRKTGGGQ